MGRRGHPIKEFHISWPRVSTSQCTPLPYVPNNASCLGIATKRVALTTLIVILFSFKSLFVFELTSGVFFFLSKFMGELQIEF